MRKGTPYHPVMQRNTQPAISEAQIREALEASRGSVRVAAEALGISHPTLYKLMRVYGIEIRRIVA